MFGNKDVDSDILLLIGSLQSLAFADSLLSRLLFGHFSTLVLLLCLRALSATNNQSLPVYTDTCTPSVRHWSRDFVFRVISGRGLKVIRSQNTGAVSWKRPFSNWTLVVWLQPWIGQYSPLEVMVLLCCLSRCRRAEVSPGTRGHWTVPSGCTGSRGSAASTRGRCSLWSEVNFTLFWGLNPKGSMDLQPCWFYSASQTCLLMVSTSSHMNTSNTSWHLRVKGEYPWLHCTKTW